MNAVETDGIWHTERGQIQRSDEGEKREGGLLTVQLRGRVEDGALCVGEADVIDAVLLGRERPCDSVRGKRK